jgi:hypothetical protein
MFGVVKPNKYQRAYVARGAGYLDTHLPGWEQFVDWKSLDLSSVQNCVLAQLGLKDPRLTRRDSYGSPFHRAQRQLPYIDDLGSYGFSNAAGGNVVMSLAWRDEINRRLGIDKEATKIKRDLRIVEPDEAYLASVLGQAAYELVA